MEECKCTGGILYKLNEYAQAHKDLRNENLELKYKVDYLENQLLKVKQYAKVNKQNYIVQLIENALEEID